MPPPRPGRGYTWLHIPSQPLPILTPIIGHPAPNVNPVLSRRWMILPVELLEILLIDVGIDLGGADVHVPEHRLDEPEVSPPLQQMGRTEAAQTHYIPLFIKQFPYLERCV